MIPLTREEAALVAWFIRSHKITRTRLDFAAIIMDIGCERHNIKAHAEQVKLSTRQRRDQLAELEAVHKALSKLSYDAEETLRRHLASGMMTTRNVQTWTTDGRDVKGITKAAELAVNNLRRIDQPRGAGKDAVLKRHFVREAARLYLFAGFETISANDTATFAKWCALLDSIIGTGLSGKGSFRRAILDEIGDAEDKREAWKAKIITGLVRHFPEGFALHF